MAHHKRKGPKSTRAGCLLCKPQKRQGAPKQSRQKFSELRKLTATEDMLVEQGADDLCSAYLPTAFSTAVPAAKGIKSTPNLPLGRLPVIDNEKWLKQPLLSPVVIFSELKHKVDFECGDGNGYDEFLDHATILSDKGEIINGGEGLTIRNMLNLDAASALYPHRYNVKELVATINEDDERYFNRRGITLDDLAQMFSTGYYEDTLSTCCGIPGCGSSYALIRKGKCDVLFEVSAGGLVSVEFFAFEILD